MALRRTLHLRKHTMTQGSNHCFGWERYPAKLYNGALSIPQHPPPINYEEKMRGSGIWGPENGEILKLVLYNRLRQRKFQREPPSLEDSQTHNKLEIGIVWWCFGVLCVVGSLKWWAKKYRMVHDHYPWIPARIDGTPGTGPYYWFLE